MDEAESKIASLERRIAMLESQQQHHHHGPAEVSFDQYSDIQTQALKQFRSDVLVRLRSIRQQAVLESQQGMASASMKGECEELSRENAALKKEIERLNYRVNHLVKALSAEELKNSSAAATTSSSH